MMSVAVQIAARQRQQDFEDDRGQRQETTQASVQRGSAIGSCICHGTIRLGHIGAQLVSWWIG